MVWPRCLYDDSGFSICTEYWLVGGDTWVSIPSGRLRIRFVGDISMVQLSSISKSRTAVFLCGLAFASPSYSMNCYDFEQLINNLVSYSNRASAIVENCSRDVVAHNNSSASCSRLHGNDPTMVKFANYKQQYERFAGNSLLGGFLKGVEMAKCTNVDPAPLGQAMERYNAATQKLMSVAKK